MFGHNILCCILIYIYYFSFVGYPKPSPSPTDSQGEAVVSYKFFKWVLNIYFSPWKVMAERKKSINF